MSLETQDSLIGRHPASVVNYLYESPSTVGNDYGNIVGPCVHRILHQFLDHGSRSLHDFPCRYDIGYV